MIKLNKYYQNWQNIFKNNQLKYIELLKDAIKQAFEKQDRYTKTESHCYDSTICEQIDNKYNIDDEILKLVDKFKKLPL